MFLVAVRALDFVFEFAAHECPLGRAGDARERSLQRGAAKAQL
jgi:hypothetical protein